MVDVFTAALAGALAEVATAATVSTVASGVIGNRADALLVRSYRAISAGFRQLAAGPDVKAAQVIVSAVRLAFQRSLATYVDTLSSQATNMAERLFVEDLQTATRSGLEDPSLDAMLQLADTIRPLLASISGVASWSETTPLISPIVAWCESVAGAMPPHFRAMLTEQAPNGSPPWIMNYRDELATELLRNADFEKLLVTSQLSEVADSNDRLQAAAKCMQFSLDVVDAKLGRVDGKVDQLILLHNDQLAKLQKLSGLLHQIGSVASPEMSDRILASAMYGLSGQITPVALIFVSAFGSYRNVDGLSRIDRQLLTREVQSRLMNAAGSFSYVGRFDGGEFDVIIKEIAGIQDAMDRCHNILTAFFRPFEIGGSSFTLTPKIGVAVSPDHGFSPDALQRNADLALRSTLGYGARDIVIYSPELHSDAEDRRQIESDLRYALQADGLQLVFQPILSLSERKVVGYEALVRWLHPERGLISPAIFIPIAEDAGLIGEMGGWILQAACAVAADWPDDIWVAVNISPDQFANPEFPSTLAKALTETRLPSNRLELEITESIFLNEDQDTNKTFSDLKSLGVRLALDDFGTGYSSLGYLRTAPFDRIKIDQSFVRGATNPDSRNIAIIEAIVTLANSVKIEVTAEGIETESELELVEFLGCTHVQGYMLGRPLSADQICAVAG